MGGHPVQRRRDDAGRCRPIAAALAAAWLSTVFVPTTVAAPDGALDAPVSAIWAGMPLRAWAERATALAGRPVILDRRLDPDVTVTRDCRGEPLGDVLAAVAAEARATVEPLRSWIRIGPAAAAGRATRGERDRAAELARLPAVARAALAARAAWSWPAGARPRDLVASAADSAGVTVSELEAIPHDHLPGLSLPPLPLAERLDLLLAHFDLRVAWTASPANAAPVGRIVPLADAALPDTALGADRPIRPRPEAGNTRSDATQRYTLALEAPLGEALEALGPRLGLEPEIDRASLAARGVLPGEIVRARLTEATRDQVLDALVAPLGLRWRIEGTRLIVDAPPP